MTELIFGDIPGYPEGSWFENRAKLAKVGVHRMNQAGIAGRAKEGADSIVLSGGYEDDEDHGDVIIYTGEGGRDANTGQQITDQKLIRGNLALARSRTTGQPVRVIRGNKHRSPYSPKSGYSYDGLFRVEDYWHKHGKSGHRIWQFRLVKIYDEDTVEFAGQEIDDGSGVPLRQKISISRIVRDTAKTRWVKELYDCRCQVCGIRLEGPGGPYAEGAHIQPLGRPHNGPDVVENILCLCPNHHVLLDIGAFSIRDDLTLIGLEGRLTVRPRHKINKDFLRYRRDHYQ